MTDQLERDLRAANPLRSRRTDALSARAEADLASILAGARAAEGAPTAEPTPVAPLSGRPRRRAARIGWTVAAVAAVTAAVVITATSLTVSPEVSVASPPELVATPIDAALPEVLAELTAQARALPGDTAPAQTIESEEWSGVFTIDEPDTVTSFFVQPQQVLRVREADLSGFIETRAGEVRWGDPTAPDVAEPGELLYRVDFGPGEYGLSFPQPPPDTGDALRAYIDTTYGYGESTPTGIYFTALRDLRSEWAMSGPQAAGVLELVGALPDVELLGEVTDRLGRDGIAVTTDVDGTVRYMLVFDPTTGSLLSTEITHLGGNPDLAAVPAGTVMQYVAWKEP